MSIFKRRIKSALYIDFENVPLNADHIANVIAWLEDGLFEDPRQKRTFVERRVYWNSQANRHRKAFEAHQFEVVLIEKYGGLKNGADIRIAMDMVEATFKRRQIDEFILISKDSDFVPVIQRLGEKDKRTIMMVEEQQPAAYTAYDLHADGIITHRTLLHDAQAYVRPKRGLMEKLGLAGGKSKAAKKASATNGAAEKVAATAAAKLPNKPKATAGDQEDTALTGVVSRKSLIDQAVDEFVKVSSRNPGKLTGKQTLLKQLKNIKGFTNTGAKPYIGFKTYEALVKEIAERDPRITIQADRLGGIAVVYVPGDATADTADVADAVPKPTPALAETAPAAAAPSLHPASEKQLSS
jgi:uncharacterized LabA/DUF88 family protein